ncbi:hypothetical protein TNCV_1936321 [Trichonephila clavipes]|nr:hypothetical protein TNCV_1936321 [Trichonephila clavipes]
MNLQDYNLPGITSENHAFEDEHTVQKDESVKLKEEIKPKVDENYMSIILESVPKTYKNQASLLLNTFLKIKPSTIIAKEEFLQALQELNIPRHYIKNKYLKTPFVKQEMQAVPVKRKQYVKPVAKGNRIDEKPKYER